MCMCILENEGLNTLMSYSYCGLLQKEIESINHSAYSNRSDFGTKFFEDTESQKRIKKQIQAGTPIAHIYEEFGKHDKTEIDNAIVKINSSSLVSEFWFFDKKGKCHISNSKFKAFLEQNGFCKYYPDNSDTFIFIKVENCFIDNTSPAVIKDFVLSYLEKQETLAPYELMAGSPKYFKEDYLSLLNAKEIVLFEDAEDYAMVYFNNCAVKVFANKIEQIDYLELDGMVWRKHAINRDFILTDKKGGYFERFFVLATGTTPERVLSMKTTMGYLMHSFKTLSNNRAVIFNDETISDNPNGGSGKGILISAISQIKRVSIIDGKQFEFNKSFAYQTVSADTQILFFDDVKKNFAFENLFSLITEGITLEKKNKDAIKIPVRKSPKIAITTNYTIVGSGGSHDRRKHDVEMSSYFSSNHTPADEFNVQLFDDFSEIEWQLFDNFMINCIQTYLREGLVKAQSVNLELRKFTNATSYEFYEFTQDGFLPLNERFSRGEKYLKFKEANPDYFRLSEKRFKAWIDSYCEYIKAEHLWGTSTTGRYSYISTNKEIINLKKEDDGCPF